MKYERARLARSDSAGQSRGHWLLTVINKYLLQPSVGQDPADTLYTHTHISVCGALSRKETLEWKERALRGCVLEPEPESEGFCF